MEIVGLTEPRQLKPWLDGRGEAIDNMDAEQARAKTIWDNWSVAPSRSPEEVATAKADLEKARRHKKQTMKQWETDWWDRLSEEAEEADRRGDWGALYRILSRLRDRVGASVDGSKAGCARRGAPAAEDQVCWS